MHCPGSLGILQPVAGSLLVKWVNKDRLGGPPGLSLHLHSFLLWLWPRNPLSCLSCPCSWIQKSGEQPRLWRKAESRCSGAAPPPCPPLTPTQRLKVLFCNISSKITLAFKVGRAVEKKKISWDLREMAQLQGVYIATLLPSTSYGLTFYFSLSGETQKPERKPLSFSVADVCYRG